MDARKFLDDVAGRAQARFDAGRTVLSFGEYLSMAMGAPAAFGRAAPQLLRDAILFHGLGNRAKPTGEVRRMHLFDASFEDGRGAVAGQEEVAAQLLHSIDSFCSQGRVDRLLVLHGPNGSAKSSIVATLMRALESYSTQSEGAVYRFSWIFPKTEVLKGRVGFGGKDGGSAFESYAHLPPDAVDAKLGCDLKDHPYRLLPAADRAELFDAAKQAYPRFVPGASLISGGLCRSCRTIFDALMTAYDGDFARVLSHVQVERFSFSRRYLRGAVTVEPQMSVDASVRAIALDRSAASLPPALQTVNLLNTSGPLVDGNRGIIEYADLLKRPLEAFKYLLGTSETGEVRMEHLLLELDAVLIASTNEMHLSAFKEMPDFSSFKGRMELVRVPYLRRVEDERAIYERRFQEVAAQRHVAPHALDVAARWAVLTRLSKPNASLYEEKLQALVGTLTPIDKMRLFDTGEVPERCSLEEANLLRAAIPSLYEESSLSPAYEGLFGASPREIFAILQASAWERGRPCIDVPAVIEALAKLVQETNVYTFLGVTGEGGYRDYAGFVEGVRELWLDEVEEEVREALGLVAEGEYRERFTSYILTVSSWLRGEQLPHHRTGVVGPADEAFMQQMEEVFLAGEEAPKLFREGLISKIGAFWLERPAQKGLGRASAVDSNPREGVPSSTSKKKQDEAGLALDYPAIFPGLYRKLKEKYHQERREELRRLQETVFKVLDPEDLGKSLALKEREQITDMMDTMRSKHGYCDHCARSAVQTLLRSRYP